jgi:hypothetical protein
MKKIKMANTIGNKKKTRMTEPDPNIAGSVYVDAARTSVVIQSDVWFGGTQRPSRPSPARAETHTTTATTTTLF